MKALVAALMLLAPLPATAQTAGAQIANPEQSYLKTRDAAIEKLSKIDINGPGADRARKMEEAAHADLEKRLQAMIGKPVPKGVKGPGLYNVVALLKGDVGFGTLDGLTFKSQDDTLEIVVSTEALTRKWLVEHEDWWENQENVPQELAAALTSEAFYTQAVSADAAVSFYTDLPIAKPPGASAAAAMLVVRRQDIGPSVPEEILAASVQGGRVYIVSKRTEGIAKDIPACAAIWDQGLKEAEKRLEAYKASDNKDEKAFDDYTKIQDRADTDMRKCYGERAKAEPFLGELTKIAQQLLNDLPK